MYHNQMAAVFNQTVIAVDRVLYRRRKMFIRVFYEIWFWEFERAAVKIDDLWKPAIGF